MTTQPILPNLGDGFASGACRDAWPRQSPRSWTTTGGSCFTLSFAAGLGALLAAVSPRARGETSSAFFFVVYVAISVPVAGIGVLGELATLRTAGLTCTAAVGVLVLLVLALIRRRLPED